MWSSSNRHGTWYVLCVLASMIAIFREIDWESGYELNVCVHLQIHLLTLDERPLW